MTDVNKVIDKNLCTGCGICASVFDKKIEILKQDYNRPHCKERLNNDELAKFKKICPGINQKSVKSSNLHPIWGPILSSHIGYSNDDEIRFLGSSGGIVTRSLLYALESKLATLVVQISADGCNPLENTVKISRTRADLITATGSRYSPASPLESIIQIIDDNPNDKIAFVGKPCDCTALRNLMEIDRRVKDSVSLVISFFCAGTPSRNGVMQVTKALGIDESKNVDQFYFRGRGWPGKTTLRQEESVSYMEYSKSWGELLGPTIQNRCKFCADGTGEVADIVSADVWHSDDRGYPLFTESDGQGLILARSNLGNQLVKDMLSSGIISATQYNIDDLAKIQVTQFERKSTLLVRAVAKSLASFTFIRLKNQRALLTFRYLPLNKQLRVFVGSFIRAVKGRM
ncbi:Coenzyme F420 hydrogenase/dehydrogenase, beta subunit C-terminal domain [Vibrio vulnificus]|uniref:Coenzyme F420 hydrogenase/dehydrogenase, beta subunit C-terminal domain n=1 Tax=Vibrio vulnificus TaxID=672 RepID=A0AAW4H9V3_VIBVL|nr:Coenzyme F420 hydrogenase/dehydrogenase, beta subunit C-terminal domain [Vibrio vulnificus]MBN8121710.1 Coenzyme F420 hydrogenase/dehydrogenase, beta subunit C-terminal domain [Vibrio vulnificus]